jgi:hypothetical protein
MKIILKFILKVLDIYLLFLIFSYLLQYFIYNYPFPFENHLLFFLNGLFPLYEFILILLNFIHFIIFDYLNLHLLFKFKFNILNPIIITYFLFLLIFHNIIL